MVVTTIYITVLANYYMYLDKKINQNRHKKLKKYIYDSNIKYRQNLLNIRMLIMNKRPEIVNGKENVYSIVSNKKTVKLQNQSIYTIKFVYNIIK